MPFVIFWLFLQNSSCYFMKKHIPNSITCLNLICGVFAIIAASQFQFKHTAYAIALAAVFDFLDGFAARLLNAKSLIGKDLDSLADIVSFGVAPALSVFFYLSSQTAPDFPCADWLPFTALLIPVFSAIRLARFNHDDSQTDTFRGLATPANALFFTFLIAFYQPDFTLLVILVFIFSILLNLPVRMFSLKFKNLKFRENAEKFIFLALSLMLIVFFLQKAVPLIISLYVLMSVTKIEKMFKKEN